LQNHSDNDIVFFKEVSLQPCRRYNDPENQFAPFGENHEQNPISRRQFLQTSAVTTALDDTRRIALDPARIPSSWEVPPSDRVRFGIIGWVCKAAACSQRL